MLLQFVSAHFSSVPVLNLFYLLFSQLNWFVSDYKRNTEYLYMLLYSVIPSINNSDPVPQESIKFHAFMIMQS